MINVEGFLSAEIVNYEKRTQRSYPALLKYYEDINRFGQDTIFKIKIERSLLYQWCLAALFLRALSNFQAIYILSIKGMTSEARILLRTLTEIQYIVIAIQRNHDIAKDYLGQEAIESKRLFKNVKKWPEQLPESIKVQEIIDKLDELNKEIHTHKIRKYTISNWAESANMLPNYETYYGLLCLSSHANIADVRKHFVLDESGILSTFKWGPDVESVPETMLSTLQTMLQIIESIGKSFEVDISETMQQKVEGFESVRHCYKGQK
jgi:hypothetical protein